MSSAKTCANPECWCSGQPQSSKNFGSNRSTSDGLAAYCKTCAAAKQREWKHAHPEKVRAWKQRYLAQVKEKRA